MATTPPSVPILARERLGHRLEPASGAVRRTDRELHPEPLAPGRPLLGPLSRRKWQAGQVLGPDLGIGPAEQPVVRRIRRKRAARVIDRDDRVAQAREDRFEAIALEHVPPPVDTAVHHADGQAVLGAQRGAFIGHQVKRLFPRFDGASNAFDAVNSAEGPTELRSVGRGRRRSGGRLASTVPSEWAANSGCTRRIRLDDTIGLATPYMDLVELVPHGTRVRCTVRRFMTRNLFRAPWHGSGRFPRSRRVRRDRGAETIPSDPRHHVAGFEDAEYATRHLATRPDHRRQVGQGEHRPSGEEQPSVDVEDSGDPPQGILIHEAVDPPGHLVEAGQCVVEDVNGEPGSVAASERVSSPRHTAAGLRASATTLAAAGRAAKGRISGNSARVTIRTISSRPSIVVRRMATYPSRTSASDDSSPCSRIVSPVR